MFDTNPTIFSGRRSADERGDISLIIISVDTRTIQVDFKDRIGERF